MHKQNALKLQRAVTLQNWPLAFFYSNTNVHFVDFNMFAKFDEIPSLPVQDIKEKPKCCGQSITKGNNSNRITHSLFNTNVHFVDFNMFAKFDEIPSLPVQDIKEKPKCCGQSITKGNNSNRISP